MGFRFRNVLPVVVRRPLGRIKRRLLRRAGLMPMLAMDPGFAARVRLELSRPHLKGRGLEIGAGPWPQLLPEGCTCEYFDKRKTQELGEYFQVDAQNAGNVLPLEAIPKRFPHGADFLIAHHVLEHASNPLRELGQWFGAVRDGGVCVLSVPDAAQTPDRGRLVAPLEHLLADYLLNRDDDSFESREHIYSFAMGWIDEGYAKGMDKAGVAAMTHDNAHAARNDLHWHAYDQELFLEALLLSARLSGVRLGLLALASPAHPAEPGSPEQEVLAICRVVRGPGEGLEAATWNGRVDRTRVDSALDRLLDQLREGLRRLDSVRA